MAWGISSGPEELERHGFDATIWRWNLRDPGGLATYVNVKVSGTAMATAPEYLPQATLLARATRGRSEVEKVLEWWQPPRVVELHTHSIEGNAVGGSRTRPGVEEREAERRIAAIEQWFLERGFELWFDELTSGNWLALIIPTGARVGAADTGSGGSKLDAAEDALRRYLAKDAERRDVTIEAPPAVLNLSAPAPSIVISPEGIPSEEEFGLAAVAPEELEAERNRLDELAADFGWQILFAAEPDGSWFWLVRDAESQETVKWGEANTWQDSRQSSIFSRQAARRRGQWINGWINTTAPARTRGRSRPYTTRRVTRQV